MYFDLAPKTDEKDFFNYREQLDFIKNHVGDLPLIVVRGQRRVGKTSLMMVFYNQYDGPKAWLNMYNVRDKNHFYQLLSIKLRELLLQSSPLKKIEHYLSRIQIQGIGLKEDEWHLSLEYLKDIKGLLIIDEAQLGMDYGIDRWLAFAYDHLNIHILVAGSQIGLLEALLGRDRSPLRGKLLEYVDMRPLSLEMAKAFLLEGFAQAQKKVSLDEIEEAAAKLGGLMGWLTYYGHLRLRMTHEQAMERLFSMARDIIAEELSHLNQKELVVLASIVQGFGTWSEIKRYVFVKFNITLPDSSLHRILKRLVDLSFVQKVQGGYQATEPLLAEGLRVLLPNI